MRFALVLVVVAVSNAAAGPAQPARPLQPVQVAQDQAGGDDVVVRALTLRGVKAIDQTKLKGVLATRPSARLPWGRKRFFDRLVLEADLQRIQAFYADRGYPDARVTSTDLKFNAQRTAVEVVVTVSEGDPVNVEAIEFNGFDRIPVDHLNRVKRDIPLRVGRPRDRALVIVSHDMALNELRDHGYPSARIATDETVGVDGKTATVVFTAEPGVLAHFGTVEINITGSKSVGENVIRRELDYKPGDLYRRSLIQNTQRRLYGLALFQFVTIEASEPNPLDASVGTRVTLVEGKHHRLNFGVGYGTEEEGRVDAEYSHLNFFGGARTASVHGRWSSLDRGVRVNFNQPYFLGAHLSLGGEAQHWYTYAPAYTSIVTGARATLTHRSGRGMLWSVSIGSERSNSSVAESVLNDPTLIDELIALGIDPATGKQEGTLGVLGFDLQRSRTDSFLNPRRGYQLAVHAEEAGVLPGSFNFYALAVDGRHYQSVGDGLVVATRLQVGNIDAVGADETNVPFSKKYFLGGPNTLRGWGLYEVSPLSTSGLPLGGNSLLSFSAEARATVEGQPGRRGLPRCGECVGGFRRLRSERFTVLDWTGAPLSNADRSHSVRRGLSTQSHPRPREEWPAADQSSAVSLQHRRSLLICECGHLVIWSFGHLVI